MKLNIFWLGMDLVYQAVVTSFGIPLLSTFMFCYGDLLTTKC